MSRAGLSLRARLVLIVAVALVAGGTGLAVLVFHVAMEQAEEAFDDQLAEVAGVLLAVAPGQQPGHVVSRSGRHEAAEDADDDRDDDGAARRPGDGRGRWRGAWWGSRHANVLAPAAPGLGGHLLYQVWRVGPALAPVVRSARAPVQPLVAPVGYSELTWGGRQWRLLVAEREGLRVIVGQERALRARLARELAGHAVLPLALGAAAVSVLTALVLGLGLRPLSRLASDVAQLAPDRPEALPARLRPRELALLAGAIDGLLARVRRALEQERRLTADAAHELRTPLAALSAQLQAAQSAGDEAVRAGRIDAALGGVQRMTRLVEQLLAAARLDALDTVDCRAIDLAALVRAECAERAPAGLALGVTLALDAPEVLMWPVQPDLLRAALRNLIDNAMRHAPSGSVVEVALVLDAEGCLVSVRDRGPALPAEVFSRLGERFMRGPAAGPSGAGLGLSIVRRIAALHGGTLGFAPAPGGGLRVTLRLPRRA